MTESKHRRNQLFKAMSTRNRKTFRRLTNVFLILFLSIHTLIPEYRHTCLPDRFYDMDETHDHVSVRSGNTHCSNRISQYCRRCCHEAFQAFAQTYCSSISINKQGSLIFSQLVTSTEHLPEVALFFCQNFHCYTKRSHLSPFR